MKKVIGVISNDWHIKGSNHEDVLDLVTQQCELAKELGVTTLFALGDIFNDRKAVTVNDFDCFGLILDRIKEFDMTLIAIPGNHEKQSYTSDSSFLSPFKHHPALTLMEYGSGYKIGDMSIHLLPYYKDDYWFEEYHKLRGKAGAFDKSRKYVLMSHQAINGSTNNDGSVVEVGIGINDFLDYDLVLLGHYHNKQQLGTNIYHLPSIQQNNFGENEEKGFTILYDDATIEFRKSLFKPYKKVSIDVDKLTKKQISEKAKEYSQIDANIQFEFTGSSSLVKAINKDEFTALGISVKIKVKEIEDTLKYTDEIVKEYNSENIIEEFKEFCEEKEKSFDEGIVYLNTKINE